MNQENALSLLTAFEKADVTVNEFFDSGLYLAWLDQEEKPKQEKIKNFDPFNLMGKNNNDLIQPCAAENAALYLTDSANPTAGTGTGKLYVTYRIIDL